MTESTGAPTMPVPPAAPGEGGRRDGRIFASLVLASLVLVGGLWGISRGAPSATQLETVVLPTPKVTADEGCAQFARYWMVDSGAGVPAEAIVGVSNCFQTEAGEWFVPNGAADRRLAATFELTEDERERTLGVRARIRADIAALEALMPSGLRSTLRRNYDIRNLPVTGHTRWGVDQYNFGPAKARYTRLAQAFLMSPERVWLADYVGWMMGERIAGAAAFDSACLADPDLRFLERACTGVRFDLELESIPLIWELNDAVAMAQYLDMLANSGRTLPASGNGAG